MGPYLMLLGAAVLLAAMFSLNKIYQKQNGTSLQAGFGFSALLGLFSASLFFCINGFSAGFSGFSLLLAGMITVFAVGYTLLGFQIIKNGSMTVYTLFLMAGGMAVPYLWGLLFLNEPFSWKRTAGLIMIIGAIVLSNWSGKKEKTKISTLLACVAVFFLNGGTSVVSKLHQIETNEPTVSTTEFIILSGLCKFVLAGGCWLILRTTRGKRNNAAPGEIQERKLWVLLLIIVGAAVADGLSYLLQLLGASSLPATVLYPFVTGGSIAFSALVDRIIFKTKIIPRMAVGILLCVLGTILFL